jgi:hypothetical protein
MIDFLFFPLQFQIPVLHLLGCAGLYAGACTRKGWKSKNQASTHPISTLTSDAGHATITLIYNGKRTFRWASTTRFVSWIFGKHTASCLYEQDWIYIMIQLHTAAYGIENYIFYIQLHTGYMFYILACKKLVTYSLHTDDIWHIQITCQLWSGFMIHTDTNNCIRFTYGLHMDFIRITYGLHTGYIHASVILVHNLNI